MNYIFFAIISLLLVTAAGLQAYFAAELGDNCETKLATASIIAAVSLFGSFVFNGIWVWANRKKMSKTKRVAITFWTAAVVVGTAAAGAALGQAELYADLACEVEHSEELHYASIALLVLSIALPHAMQKRQSANKFADAAGKPLKNLQPLRFI